jgi:hypothetical protein
MWLLQDGVVAVHKHGVLWGGVGVICSGRLSLHPCRGEWRAPIQQLLVLGQDVCLLLDKLLEVGQPAT